MSEETKCWRYYMPCQQGEGWAVVFLDSMGVLSTVSDWGNWGYRWSNWGHEDFRSFVLSLRADYLTEKFAPGRVFSGSKTAEAVRRHIVENRKDRTFSKEQAQEEWDLIEEYTPFNDAADFDDWIGRTKLEEPWFFATLANHPMAESFCARVLPRLKDAIRAELAAEQPEVRHA